MNICTYGPYFLYWTTKWDICMKAKNNYQDVFNRCTVYLKMWNCSKIHQDSVSGFYFISSSFATDTFVEKLLWIPTQGLRIYQISPSEATNMTLFPWPNFLIKYFQPYQATTNPLPPLSRTVRNTDALHDLHVQEMVPIIKMDL